MAADEPFCEFCPSKAPPVVRAFRQEVQHVPITTYAGKIVKSYQFALVDYHCTACHKQGTNDVRLDWNPHLWQGPKSCSCGQTSPADIGV